MILPPFILITFIPWFAFLSLIGNFIIDSLVLLIISFVVFKKMDWTFYSKTIFKVWLLGFVSDFIGVIFLLIAYFIARPKEYYQGVDIGVLKEISNGFWLAMNGGSALESMWSFLYILSGIIVAAIAIFIFDYFISFRKSSMTKRQKMVSAFIYAIFTAPYTFFLPESLFR